MIGAIVSILGGWRATAFALVALAAMGVAWVQTERIEAMQARMLKAALNAAQAEAHAQARARQAEQDMAKAAAQASAEYERGKQDAQATADAVAADLRTGALRLRREWAQCETGRLSAAAASAREFDAAEQSRAESAGRIVRAAAECDAQVTGLQALVREYTHG